MKNPISSAILKWVRKINDVYFIRRKQQQQQQQQRTSELTSGKRTLSRFLRNPISYVALFYKCYTSITDFVLTVDSVCGNICIYLTIYHSHSFTFFIRLFLLLHFSRLFQPNLHEFNLANFLFDVLHMYCGMEWGKWRLAGGEIQRMR